MKFHDWARQPETRACGRSATDEHSRMIIRRFIRVLERLDPPPRGSAPMRGAVVRDKA